MNIEPPLEDVLADPIVHLVMRRDRVGLDDLRALIAVAQQHLRMTARGRGEGVVERAPDPKARLRFAITKE